MAGQAVTLTASLSDTSVNPIAPVANQTINLGLGGGLSCNAVTHGSGLARCPLTPTVTWSSTNATACTASGAWSGSKATSGTQTETRAATGTLTYTFDCTGSGGSTSASASLTVTKIVVTGSTGTGGGGGGALDWATLAGLAFLVLGMRGGLRGDSSHPRPGP